MLKCHRIAVSSQVSSQVSSNGSVSNSAEYIGVKTKNHYWLPVFSWHLWLNAICMVQNGIHECQEDCFLLLSAEAYSFGQDENRVVADHAEMLLATAAHFISFALSKESAKIERILSKHKVLPPNLQQSCGLVIMPCISLFCHLSTLHTVWHCWFLFSIQSHTEGSHALHERSVSDSTIIRRCLCRKTMDLLKKVYSCRVTCLTNKQTVTNAMCYCTVWRWCYSGYSVYPMQTANLQLNWSPKSISPSDIYRYQEYTMSLRPYKHIT